MGGYAGDNYRPGTDREHFVGAILLVALCVAAVGLLVACIVSKWS